MIQIRVTDYDGSNPIILHNAEEKQVSNSISSSDEGIVFTIAKKDPKSIYINPKTEYTKFIEAWDTDTNKRLNYGPIDNVSENPDSWTVTAKGRSQILVDLRKSETTYYKALQAIVDDLRYDNLSVAPTATALVASSKTSTEQTTVFGTVTVNENYQGLSEKSKFNAIDSDVGFGAMSTVANKGTGTIKVASPSTPPPRGSYYTAKSYWSGMSTADSFIADLGDVYKVTKIKAVMPWWGGIQRYNNRSYDFSLAYADDSEATVTTIQDRDFGPFHEIYSTTDNRVGTTYIGWDFYVGAPSSGIGYQIPVTYALPSLDVDYVNARYIRMNITDVHAWFGSTFDSVASTDGYDYQCNPAYVTGSFAHEGDNVGVMKGKTISDREVLQANDCHASIVELGVYKKVIDTDIVKPLVFQKIDNNNLQIKYYHDLSGTDYANENRNIAGGFRKYEPGGFFRHVTVTWTGATTNHTKFFSTDCSNCYPDGFHFGILDQNTSMVYASDDSSGSVNLILGAETSSLTMRGSSTAKVIVSDAWPSASDVLSYGGSYSFSKTLGDYAVIHFRGQSFTWYATVPSTETGATVKIEERHKVGNVWTGWTVLEPSLTLPNDIAAQVVWDAKYEFGIFSAETTYEVKITNLDGGYASIDSIEGYWSGSFATYNEDSDRFQYSAPETVTQIYDSRFSNGSVYKWNTLNTRTGLTFIGDRVVVTSYKGPNHGKLRIAMFYRDANVGYDPGTADHIFIPGGDPIDGHIDINLATSKRHEIPQFVAFDSDDYFTGDNALSWGRYAVIIGLYDTDEYTTQATNLLDDSNLDRCHYCKTPSGPDITTNKYVYLDSIGVHELVGFSVDFNNETHLDQLKAVTDAAQVEWEITDDGIRVEPRIGTDTMQILREGQNTLIDWEITHDVSNSGTTLISKGADIDGLSLTAIVESRRTKRKFGRTVMREADFTSLSDYFQLVGVTRVELWKREVPDLRVTITHITSNNLTLSEGDSFIVYTIELGPMRFRINKITRTDSTNGNIYEMDCVEWPPRNKAENRGELPIITTIPVLAPPDSDSPEPDPSDVPEVPLTLDATAGDTEVDLSWS